MGKCAMAAKRLQHTTDTKCWGNSQWLPDGKTTQGILTQRCINAQWLLKAKRSGCCALGKCAVAAKRVKNATAAKCWGNALRAVAAKNQKFATDDKGFGNAQWLLNAKNTQRWRNAQWVLISIKTQQKLRAGEMR